MNRAFIFDMDGVLVDSERIWASEEHEFMAGLFGEDIADKIGSTMGVSINEVYRQAVSYGTSVRKDELVRRFDKTAASIYAKAKLTEGTNELVRYLVSRRFKLGIVSASRMNGIEKVLRQLPFRNVFEVDISINDNNFPSKPAPDGYVEALKLLDAEPNLSIVLEDSNRGIQSAKNAGCFVIGFRGLLVAGHLQEGADAYADTMNDVARLVENRFQFK